MAKDFAFMFYPGDYLRDTQCLSEKSQVAYDRIMCEHMRKICITQEQHSFFTKRLNTDEKQELDMVLSKVDGGYQIDWVVESINKRLAYSDSRRNNRVKKEEIPKKDMNNISEVMEDENENELKVDKGAKVFKKMTKEDMILFQSKLLQETMFIEQLMMSKEIRNKADMLGWIKYYNLHIIGEEKLNKDYKEYKIHFKNWIVKFDTTKPPPINGSSLSVVSAPVQNIDDMAAKYR